MGADVRPRTGERRRWYLGLSFRSATSDQVPLRSPSSTLAGLRSSRAPRTPILTPGSGQTRSFRPNRSQAIPLRRSDDSRRGGGANATCEPLHQHR